jgi:hypothetical protein
LKEKDAQNYIDKNEAGKEIYILEKTLKEANDKLNKANRKIERIRSEQQS